LHDAGNLGEEAILLRVESALQRVGTTAVAPQACLIAGLGQWLGLAVVAKHGEVEEASVQVQSLPSSGDSTPAGRAFVPMDIDSSRQGWLHPLGPLPGQSSCPQHQSSATQSLRTSFRG
jgi:hypothetical protein